MGVVVAAEAFAKAPPRQASAHHGALTPQVAAEAFVEMVDTGVVTPTASAAISPAAAEPSTAIVGAPPAADSSVRTGADSSVRTADSSVEAAILFESLLTEVGTPDCT